MKAKNLLVLPLSPSDFEGYLRVIPPKERLLTASHFNMPACFMDSLLA